MPVVLDAPRMGRTLARMDVSSRSFVALVEAGTCFVVTSAEFAFGAERTYMLALPDDADVGPFLSACHHLFGASSAPALRLHDSLAAPSIAPTRSRAIGYRGL